MSARRARRRPPPPLRPPALGPTPPASGGRAWTCQQPPRSPPAPYAATSTVPGRREPSAPRGASTLPTRETPVCPPCCQLASRPLPPRQKTASGQPPSTHTTLASPLQLRLRCHLYSIEYAAEPPPLLSAIHSHPSHTPYLGRTAPGRTMVSAACSLRREVRPGEAALEAGGLQAGPRIRAAPDALGGWWPRPSVSELSFPGCP